MTVKDLIRQLMEFEENSEVIIYDDEICSAISFR